jgi:geranylgeranyl diphosphate synthase type II
VSIHLVTTAAGKEAEQPARRTAARAYDDPSYLRAVVERRLSLLLPPANQRPHRLHGAMRHAALSPGKRLRPLLTLLASFECGCTDMRALDAACAIEMVHAASLVLDDLPAMDDAALRRGVPTTHRVYGEDIATLAAVGLLNRAYAIMAGLRGVDPATRLSLVGLLTETVGSDGLLGGQEQDLRDARKLADVAGLDQLNHAKTGVLFAAALEAGALIGCADEAGRTCYRMFARHLGHAFQTLDDLLDATASEAEVHKDVRKDAHKPSLVRIMGPEAARRRVFEELERGCALLEARAAKDSSGAGGSVLAVFVRQSFARALP